MCAISVHTIDLPRRFCCFLAVAGLPRPCACYLSNRQQELPVSLFWVSVCTAFAWNGALFSFFFIGSGGALIGHENKQIHIKTKALRLTPTQNSRQGNTLMLKTSQFVTIGGRVQAGHQVLWTFGSIAGHFSLRPWYPSVEGQPPAKKEQIIKRQTLQRTAEPRRARVWHACC